MTQDTGSTTGTSSKSGETPSPPGSSGIEISTRRRWPLIVGALDTVLDINGESALFFIGVLVVVRIVRGPRDASRS